MKDRIYCSHVLEVGLSEGGLCCFNLMLDTKNATNKMMKKKSEMTPTKTRRMLRAHSRKRDNICLLRDEYMLLT